MGDNNGVSLFGEVWAAFADLEGALTCSYATGRKVYIIQVPGWSE